MFNLIGGSLFDPKRVKARLGNVWLERAKNTLLSSFWRLYSSYLISCCLLTTRSSYSYKF